MGFFSDLKDDLSQAVNELMPEENMDDMSLETMRGRQDNAQAVDMYSADLSQMLDQVEDVQKHDAAPEPVHKNNPPQAAHAPHTEHAAKPKAEEKREDTQPQQARKSVDEVAILTETTLINGNIATEGGLEVRGSIVGNVETLGKLNITGTIQGNSQAAEIYAEGAKISGELRSQGTIKIGTSTVIVGNIYANSAVIAGAIKGDIDVKGPVILDSSAIVMGDIKSKSVQINNGAAIEGVVSQCYAEVNPTAFFEDLKKI